MPYDEIIARLHSMADPEAVAGMAKFKVGGRHTLGISMPDLRALAKEIGKNHELALQLWASGIHEARILASLIDRPQKVTESQMEQWVQDFDSWDVCDQCCMNLFRKTPMAQQKAVAWSSRPEEFIKRAGFAMMATLAVHDKKAGDETFLAWLPVIARAADDDRNFVKKAVNWALRQIGKRNLTLNRAALETARQIQQLESKSARWIARDAIKELAGEKVQQKLATK